MLNDNIYMCTGEDIRDSIVHRFLDYCEQFFLDLRKMRKFLTPIFLQLPMLCYALASIHYLILSLLSTNVNDDILGVLYTYKRLSWIF